MSKCYDSNDVCSAFDDNLIGMPCNDNDVCRTGESFDTNCNCTGGVFQDQDNDGVCDAMELPESNCGSILFLSGTESFYKHKASNKIYSVEIIGGIEVMYTAENR